MKKFLIVILGCVMFLSLFCSEKEKVGVSPHKREEVKYHCPMHPNYISDKPGECPICGMSLVPIEEEREEGLPPGSVSISPYKEQLRGVKYWKVGYLPLAKELRTVGIVVPDERKTYHVHLKFDGWIKKLYIEYEGAYVRKGDPLFTVYSEVLLSSQEEYLIAYRAYKKALSKGTDEEVETAKSLLESAKERLLLFGLTPFQIREIKERRSPFVNVTIYSPYTGYVLKKNVLEGMYVTEGTHIYEIADLSTVWIMADIYENEIPFVEIGQKVEVSSPYIPGVKVEGKVSYIYPYLKEKTRTVKVRVELPNPDLMFKPDMYVDVSLKLPVGERLVVPVDAVMRTGTKSLVFVKIKEGKLAPREIEIGPQIGHYYIVISGLEDGEEIVKSANFLVDSESKLKMAIEGMGGNSEHGGH